MNKQELLYQLVGKTVIICEENLVDIDYNLYANFVLNKQKYRYYKLHFTNKVVEYSYANSFHSVKEKSPSKYDFLSDWTKEELQKWVDFIESR